MPETTTGQSPKSKPKTPKVMGVPLTGWSIGALSLIFVLYTAGSYGIKLYKQWQGAVEAENKAEEAAKKATAVNADTNAYTNAVAREMTAHAKDPTGHKVVIHGSGTAAVTAVYFESDGCIAIQRPGIPLPYLPNPASTVEWSLGPSRKPQSTPPPLSGDAIQTEGPPSPTPSALNDHAPLMEEHRTIAPAVFTEGVTAETPRLIRVQAGCWTNGVHPGAFKTWWGPANGCWAPFYRQWVVDGCTHYQMYNACSGQWNPQIVWTHCNPNHHW